MDIKTGQLDNGNLIINTEFADLLAHSGIDSAGKLWNLHSESVKSVTPSRGTSVAFLEPLSGTDYLETYIKRYQPVSLKDKIKSKLPTKQGPYDAFHEWEALLAFHRENLPTITPIAVARYNQCSCILTLGITDYIRASELFAGFTSKDQKRKRTLIAKIADLASRMHFVNFAHQDFYLVHMFIKENENDNIFLIDLQRLVMQSKLARRWRVKDLGQLLFSARPFISNSDILYFWEIYTQTEGKRLYSDRKLIRSIFRKAARIKRHDNKKRSNSDNGY